MLLIVVQNSGNPWEAHVGCLDNPCKQGPFLGRQGCIIVEPMTVGKLARTCAQLGPAPEQHRALDLHVCMR